jgi:ABC-type oligopeptide transport system substrate-binding subunit
MRNVYGVMWAAILSSIVAVSLVFFSVPLAAGDLPEERLVKPIRFQAYSPSFQKSIAETHKYIATRLQQLGFQVDFRPENRMGTLQNVYRSRNYDLATLYFGSKPQRLDPHMHMSRWFLSTNRGIGKSNWTGYNNPDYDVIVEASARAFDKEERSRLIHATQAIIARDVPMITLVHQMEVAAYNNKKWSGFKHMVGNGIKNVWSWTEAKPLTDNKTLVIGLSHDTGILTPLKTHMGICLPRKSSFPCERELNGTTENLLRRGM